jgi:type I restriction enzyme, R subunit
LEPLPQIDDEVDELAVDKEDDQKANLKSRWADLVAHFEERNKTQDGKAMVVAMSREICVHLYNEIIKLCPDWHSDDPEQGAIKIVMTGSASDKALLRPHIYSKQQKKRLEKRFKDPSDPLRLVIVRDMWLTGFDAPCVHTLYVDKPMKAQPDASHRPRQPCFQGQARRTGGGLHRHRQRIEVGVEGLHRQPGPWPTQR